MMLAGAVGASSQSPVYFLNRGLNGKSDGTTSMNHQFNGYSGFPGRNIGLKDPQAGMFKSWMDTGLPVFDMPFGPACSPWYGTAGGWKPRQGERAPYVWKDRVYPPISQ
jgi:hypothetical protein